MKYGAFIVPTGIGASIGGFAGDASKWARKFSEKCRLIVNPNVVNAACFSGITDSMLYVEGYTLDEFFMGECNLIESANNKIGVVFDKAISQDVLNVHINTINAVKTVYDIDIIGYEITEEEVGVEFYIDETNSSMGNIKNLKTIKKSAEKLILDGAEAIAIVCHFPNEDDEDDNYSKGIGADPVGGVEAIISHYISKELRVPCAHAPAFSDYTIHSEIVDSRCSAEYITPTFLPCILLGLNLAPKIIYENSDKGGSEQVTRNLFRNDEQSKKDLKQIFVDDIEFLIVPYNAIGSIPVMEMAKKGKKIYAVVENNTVLNVNPENFNIKCDIIKTYEELYSII